MKMTILPKTRKAKIRAALVIGVPILVITVFSYLMVAMPGSSYQGPLPALTTAETESAARLESVVRMLTEEIGERNVPEYEGLVASQDYLREHLESLGYAVNLQTYEVNRREVANIEVEIQGNRKPDEFIVVGAHYDSVGGCLGADDNASGVAVVLELARLLQSRSLDRTIRLVLFVNEEPPYFRKDTMGSVVYAKACAERGDNVVAMLAIETVGYYSDKKSSQEYPFPLNLFYSDTGNFIAFVGNLSSRSLARQTVSAFRESTQFPSEGAAPLGTIPGVGWSDHWAFWQQGYPAIMITDTAPFRNPNYHELTDTAETLNYEAMARITHGLIPVIEDLDRTVF